VRKKQRAKTEGLPIRKNASRILLKAKSDLSSTQIMLCAVYIQDRVIQGRVVKKILAHILQAVSRGTNCGPTEEPVLQKMTCKDIGDELPLQHYA